MTRHINAELIEKHINRAEHHTPDERWRPESEFAKLIDSIPTADVAEVVHGEWLEDIMDYVCSQCKTSFSDELVYIKYPYELPRYCPECGAKMDGKKVE